MSENDITLALILQIPDARRGIARARREQVMRRIPRADEHFRLVAAQHRHAIRRDLNRSVDDQAVVVAVVARVVTRGRTGLDGQGVRWRSSCVVRVMVVRMVMRVVTRLVVHGLVLRNCAEQTSSSRTAAAVVRANLACDWCCWRRTSARNYRFHWPSERSCPPLPIAVRPNAPTTVDNDVTDWSMTSSSGLRSEVRAAQRCKAIGMQRQYHN